MTSLQSSQSLGSVVHPYQQQSSITDLDEALKSSPLKSRHVARDLAERYDEGVYDDGAGSQTEEDENNSVVIADSDDEDAVEHFDGTDLDQTHVLPPDGTGDKKPSNASIVQPAVHSCRF